MQIFFQLTFIKYIYIYIILLMKKKEAHIKKISYKEAMSTL